MTNSRNVIVQKLKRDDLTGLVQFYCTVEGHYLSRSRY